MQHCSSKFELNSQLNSLKSA